MVFHVFCAKFRERHRLVKLNVVRPARVRQSSGRRTLVVHVTGKPPEAQTMQRRVSHTAASEWPAEMQQTGNGPELKVHSCQCKHRVQKK